MIYQNQTLNDRWIIESIFPGKRGGYFVEAGAANGKDASSCYLLEAHLGWTGICIEPNDFFFDELVKNRPNSHCEKVCLSDTPGQISYIQGKNEHYPYLSGIKSNLENYKWGSEEILQMGKEVKKSAVPLVTLLDRHKAPPIIDYGAFDIEGSEFVVLRNFPFDRYRFLALSLEIDEWVWVMLLPILTSHGYVDVRNQYNSDMLYEKYCLHESIASKYTDSM